MKHRSPVLTAALLAAAIAAGILAPTQSLLNGELSAALDDPYTTAVISFGTGLILLTIFVLCSRQARRGLRDVRIAARRGAMPWWSFLNGAMGAMLVLSQAVTIPILGVAVFTVAVVVGQVLTGLVVDAIGLGGMPRRTPSLARLLGAGGVVVAAAITASSVPAGTGASWTTTALALLFPLTAGGLLSVQMVANGLIARTAGTAWTAVFLNFLVGSLLLLVVWACTRPIYSESVWFGPVQDWWLYIGGSLGVVMVAAQSRLVGAIGALLLGLAFIAGQLLGGLGLAALFPVAGTVTVSTIVGAALAFLAVVVGSLGGRGRQPSASIARPRPSRMCDEAPSAQ